MTYDPAIRDADTALFDQVRRLTVPNPRGYGYVPPVIGHWDRTGRTHCLDCMPETGEQDERGYPSPIDAGNSAAEGDRCDFCGASLLAAALARFGQPEAPDG